MISHLTTARNKKILGGFFFLLGAHQRSDLSLSSNEQIDQPFFSLPLSWAISFNTWNKYKLILRAQKGTQFFFSEG